MGLKGHWVRSMCSGIVNTATVMKRSSGWERTPYSARIRSRHPISFASSLRSSMLLPKSNGAMPVEALLTMPPVFSSLLAAIDSQAVLKRALYVRNEVLLNAKVLYGHIHLHATSRQRHARRSSYVRASLIRSDSNLHSYSFSDVSDSRSDKTTFLVCI